MKKIIVFTFVVAVLSGVSYGWEHPLNPDRFPSIGVALAGASASGDVTYPSAPSVGSQNAESTNASLVLDTRLPLSNSFTLSLAIGSYSETTKSDATPFLDSSKFDGSGGYFSIGGRYYFNSGAK